VQDSQPNQNKDGRRNRFEIKRQVSRILSIVAHSKFLMARERPAVNIGTGCQCCETSGCQQHTHPLNEIRVSHTFILSATMLKTRPATARILEQIFGLHITTDEAVQILFFPGG
jgi:hypothetical protein